MAYMQLAYRSSSSELNPSERVALRAEERARLQDTKVAARALSRIQRGGFTQADVHTLLEHLFLHPSVTVPQRFMVASPSSRPTSGSRQHRRIFFALTHNRSYMRQIRHKRRASTVESHYFQVPQAPLPLSYEAQRDVDYVMGRQRQGRLQVSSSYAPLFSKMNVWTPEASTAVERDALRFLTPPERR
ncbi:hypothetical protein LSCM1_06487 [Leishmania martiniquensis]|uniref:Uncharacterized protein n=1 Tax=Leishmania martiniquensis TaxID=1580590 RepID=A0A836HEU0_9TRYP|nr:hypothetical protein LSCM1_06487 [Leishmania martiniquensis]